MRERLFATKKASFATRSEFSTNKSCPPKHQTLQAESLLTRGQQDADLPSDGNAVGFRILEDVNPPRRFPI